MILLNRYYTNNLHDFWFFVHQNVYWIREFDFIRCNKCVCGLLYNAEIAPMSKIVLTFLVLYYIVEIMLMCIFE